MSRNCKVVCVTNGRHFKSIQSAARYAGVKGWTMGVKMSVAGGFIDSLGREYRRETPMKTKNNYKDTGKELKIIKSEYTKTKVSEPTEQPAQPVGEVLESTNDVVSQALWDKVEQICEQHGCWKEVSALIAALKIINNKKD